MAENTPIVVTVKDETGTTSVNAGNVSGGGSSNNKPLNQQAKTNSSKSMAGVVGTMIAMRSINYVTSNVGKWTGSTRNQQVVNNVKQLIGYGVAFAVNPILGAVTVALDGVTNALDYAYERKWEKIRVEQAQVKTGGKGGYRR